MNKQLLVINNFTLLSNENDEVIVNIPHLEIDRGDVIFLMGPNGSGKSTIVKSIFSPYNNDNYFKIESSSSVLFNSIYGYQLQLNNQEKVDRDKYLKSIVYISQEEYFGKFDSVIKSLQIQGEVALKNLRTTFDNYEERLVLLHNLVNKYALKYFKDLYVYEKKYKLEKKANNPNLDKIAIKILKKKKAIDCSGGQKKLISILSSLIKAICLDSELIVLDEPLNHLDQKNKKQICELLEIIRNKRKDNKPITMLIISHCLVFSFINDSNCYQYPIIDHSITMPLANKIYHNCLNDF